MRVKKVNYIAIFLIFLVVIILPDKFIFASNETELFTKAESYFYSQNYQLAEESYSIFIKRYPLSDLIPDVMYKKAVCLYYLNQIDRSLRLFLSVEKGFRTTRYINLIPFWKGVIYYKKNQCKLSLQNFDNFLHSEYNPTLTPKALLYSSLCYISSKEYNKAKERLDVLISKKGYSKLTPYEITLYGFILLKNRDYRSEMDFQRKINIALLPDKFRKYIDFYRAEALWFMGKKEDAIKIYNDLMGEESDIASVSFRRLYSYYQGKNNLKEMERLLIDAEHRFNNSPNVLVDVWIKMGLESFNRGDYKLAQYLLLKAFDYSRKSNVSPSYVIPLYLSEIYLKNNDLKDALDVLSQYESKIKDKKSQSYILLHLGKIYFLKEDYVNAIETYKKFIKSYPESEYVPSVNYLIAYLYYIKKDYENVLKYCNILLKLEDKKYYYPSLKMKEIVLRKVGNYRESLKTINEYIERYPDDISIRLDKIRVQFLMKEYRDVVKSSEDFLKSFSISNSRYEIISVKSSLLEIYPYILYYKGWAYYRLGDYSKAVSNFSNVEKEDNLILWTSAQFMMGWCWYQSGKYLQAGNQFSKISKELEGDKKIRAYYLAGKSFKNAGKRKKASSIFNQIIKNNKRSKFWDDSVFEYAMLLNEEGKPEEASKYYILLFKEHPRSPLVDEALYRRAEILYQAGLFRKSIDAYGYYRNNTSYGKMIDASLYWEGMAWYKIEDKDKAIEVWKKLISDFKNSSFRADAILRVAEIFVDKHEYDMAISYYNKLLSDYPKYSKEKNVEFLREKVRYLAFGYSEKEAELTAMISKSGGATSDSGRDAMLQLAEIYLSKDKNKKKIELAFQYLNKVLENGTSVQEAKAYNLLGRYFEIKKDYYSAGKNYFNAAVRNKKDKDFFTRSIYNAAYNMKKAGYRKEAYALIQILKNSYPKSVWTKKAEKLLEN